MGPQGGVLPSLNLILQSYEWCSVSRTWHDRLLGAGAGATLTLVALWLVLVSAAAAAVILCA